MRITLLPELTEAQKTQLSEWITATLPTPELAYRPLPFPMQGQLAIYDNGKLAVLNRMEYWQRDTSTIYIGYSDRNGASHALPLLDRLAVIGSVISLADLWPVHHEKFTETASRILIDTYTGVMSGMVQTEAAVSGLAFNADRSVIAARIGDCYHLPNGEQIEIDDTWTVVADRPGLRVVPIAQAA